MFKVSDRAQTKWKLFQERHDIGRGICWCELCFVNPATDLHEIINRPHYRPEDLDKVPDQLLSLLCNRCNVSVADTRPARIKLLKRNIQRYGLKSVVAEAEKFAAGIRGLDLEITLWSLLRTKDNNDDTTES